jgi:hypothetical protein
LKFALLPAEICETEYYFKSVLISVLVQREGAEIRAATSGSSSSDRIGTSKEKKKQQRSLPTCCTRFSVPRQIRSEAREKKSWIDRRLIIEMVCPWVRSRPHPRIKAPTLEPRWIALASWLDIWAGPSPGIARQPARGASVAHDRPSTEIVWGRASLSRPRRWLVFSADRSSRSKIAFAPIDLPFASADRSSSSKRSPLPFAPPARGINSSDLIGLLQYHSCCSVLFFCVLFGHNGEFC